MEKLLSDIFAMNFDIVIPLSSCLAAIILAALLFSIRYFSYRKNKRKYEKKMREKERSVVMERHIDHTPGGTFSG